MSVATHRSPTLHAARYVLATLAGRALVFAGLLVAAATLSGGDYARFALAYQIGLFANYLIGAPLMVAGFRLRARHGASALGRRLLLGVSTTAVASAAGAAVLVPSASTGLVVAVAVYGAAAVAASIMMGQASAEGYASAFARWNAWGSLLFPIGVALHQDVTVALAAAAAAMAVAPIATARRVIRAAPDGAGARLGRPPVSIFMWSLAYNSAFVILLSIAARALGAEEADHVALALTLVQAALVVPTQFALVAQPRLVSDTGMAFRRTFTGIQASLSLAVTLLAFVVAAAITTAGSLEWGVLGVMAASILPLGLGLTGGYALLLAEGAGARFVAAPWVMLALLAIAGALSAELDGGVWLAAWWAIASTAGALSQRLNASWAHLARPLAIGLGSSILCVAAGFVAPALAAVTAAALLVGVRRSLGQGLADARALIAAQR